MLMDSLYSVLQSFGLNAGDRPPLTPITKGVRTEPPAEDLAPGGGGASISTCPAVAPSWSPGPNPSGPSDETVSGTLGARFAGSP